MGAVLRISPTFTYNIIQAHHDHKTPSLMHRKDLDGLGNFYSEIAPFQNMSNAKAILEQAMPAMAVRSLQASLVNVNTVFMIASVKHVKLRTIMFGAAPMKITTL
jgi:hypothetical protein